MTDLNTVATLAAETLLKYKMDNLPIYPQKIIQDNPRAALLSFADISASAGIPRDHFVSAVDPIGGVAAAWVYNLPEGPYYLLAFNKTEPYSRIRFALACEVANILLVHTGTKPEAVRLEEVFHFARHLCYPRAMIRLCEELEIPLTEDNISAIAGSYGTYLQDLQHTPGSVVPPALNRQIRDMLRPYMKGLRAAFPFSSSGPLLDLSSYMEGYDD